MRVVIDTNVLISATTDRDLDQQSRVLPLFDASVAGEIELLVSQCSIFEFVYVLSHVYELPDDEIHALLTDLVALPGLEVLGEFDVVTWLQLWPDLVREANDAAVAAAAIATNSAVATFDRKFARQLTSQSVALWRWETS
jgi:predicted nucleic acid-binding protein